MGGNWRDDFEFAYMAPDPDSGPGLVWRGGPREWSGSWAGLPRATVILESTGRWIAYVRLQEPPGLSPVTTVGRYATVEEAQAATDQVRASR